MQETELLEALAPPKDYRLTIREGPDAPLQSAVGDPILIGTSKHCDIVLTDRAVSRRHCTVEATSAGVLLRDAGSKNGTWIGGARIEAAELDIGATIRVGRTLLLVEEDRERPPGIRSPPMDGFGAFIGSARTLQPMYRALEKAAPSDVTILLEGESGTGKEVIAEAIHEQSARKAGPFVVVDFAAIPETLVESELFGHERGAFTGAEQTRSGAFEEANGGTIFLDEIGEIPAALQTRLLGVLERKSFKRVGGRTPIDVDVRVIAATNRNLEREVEEKRFRLDLFHRLAVALIRVAPLRERREDIERLARHFAAQLGTSVRLDASAVQRLQTHDWKGNVRELRNHVERLAVFGDNAPLFGERDERADDSLASIAERAVEQSLSYRQARALFTDRFTQHYVRACLEKHDGDVARAADAAQVARRHFNRLRQR